MELILTLEQIDSDNREGVGGKSLALATMVKSGLIVPLMIATFGAFFLDLTPYPVGAALLLVLFILGLKKVNFRGK